MLDYTDSVITEGLGEYAVITQLPLLDRMKGYSVAIVMISMIFDIIVVIFVIVSCILIYSMLMINVDTKTFENGIMRMVGLTKKGFCFVILV